MRLSAEMLTMMAICVALSGCALRAKQRVKYLPKVELAESQLKIRSMQTRSFDTTDENRALRAVVATLQDFGFVILKADEALGTITARRIDEYPLRVTITVRRRGESRMLVRMNAHYRRPVRDPLIYQNFFGSLANSMFLAANSID